MNLVTDWKKAWKFWSVQLNALGIVILSFSDVINQAYTALPPSLASHVPHAKTVAIVVFGLGIISRILTQGDKNEE